MSKLSRAVALFGLVVLAALAGPVEAAEFTAKMVQTRGQDRVTGNIFVAGKKVRLDILLRMGLIVTISRLDKKLVWVINIGDKSYVEMRGVALGPGVGQTFPDELKKAADKKRLGQETVEGFVCDKYLYTFRDKRRGEVILWVARQLDYPIKTVYRNGEDKLEAVSVFKEIKVGPVDPALFEIPEGFRKIDPAKKETIE